MNVLRLYTFFAARAFRLCVGPMLAFAIVPSTLLVLAQKAPLSKSITVRGNVFDTEAQPIAQATVKLQPLTSGRGKDADTRETLTNIHGGFSFEGLDVGDYVIVASKASKQSVEMTWHADRQNAFPIGLILRVPERTVTAKTPAHNTNEMMEFSDQPHFAVAGVTDWTAAGGHGSDVTLRTSESLTSATTVLEPKANAAVVPVANKDADGYRLAGELDEKRGDPLSAVRKFEQAATLDPSEQNEFAWGSELLQHRAIWQAEEVFRRGAAAYPKSLRMQAGLGAALFAGARYEDAALQFCRASDLDPADTGPYLFLGETAVAAPKPLGCVESKLDRFVQLHPESPTANYFYAMAILKTQPNSDTASKEQAESFLNKAVSLDPKCSEAYLELGILAAKHDTERAIGFYLKAIEADAQMADAHYRLGIAYDRVGEAAKAEQEFSLHKQIEQQQAEATEKQRKTVKQFLFAKPDSPAVTAIK